jgi:hypothetical protein
MLPNIDTELSSYQPYTVFEDVEATGVKEIVDSFHFTSEPSKIFNEDAFSVQEGTIRHSIISIPQTYYYKLLSESCENINTYIPLQLEKVQEIKTYTKVPEKAYRVHITIESDKTEPFTSHEYTLTYPQPTHNTHTPLT